QRAVIPVSPHGEKQNEAADGQQAIRKLLRNARTGLSTARPRCSQEPRQSPYDPDGVTGAFRIGGEGVGHSSQLVCTFPQRVKIRTLVCLRPVFHSRRIPNYRVGLESGWPTPFSQSAR